MPYEEKQNDSRMKNRCQSWDYSQPGTYMITITLENRNRPDLGKLERCRLLEEPSTFSKDLSTVALLQECKNVRVKLSPIGRFVYDEWNSLHKKYENIVTKGCKVMPDHFHGIIWVYKPLGYSVSEIIRAFKYQTSSYFKKIS